MPRRVEPKVDGKDIEAMKRVRCVVSFLWNLRGLFIIEKYRMRLQKYLFYGILTLYYHPLFTRPPQLFEAQSFADADETSCEEEEYGTVSAIFARSRLRGERTVGGFALGGKGGGCGWIRAHTIS